MSTFRCGETGTRTQATVTRRQISNLLRYHSGTSPFMYMNLIISVLRLQRYNDFLFLASFSQTFFNIFYKIFSKQLFIKYIVFIYFCFRKNISLIFLCLFSSKIVLRHLFYIECRRYQTAR